MNIPRTVLVLSSAVFAVLGGVFTILPDRMAALVDISLTSDVARTDLMATYGGFELGFAAFLAMCATQAALDRYAGSNGVFCNRYGGTA